MNERESERAPFDVPVSSELVLSSSGEVEQLVRAHGALFAVTDVHGDIEPRGARELGLFMRDTRFLSYFVFRIEGMELVHLSSETAHDAFNQIDLMVAGTEAAEFLDDPQNFLHVRRRQLLDQAFCEEIVLTNYLGRSARLDVVFEFDADFADIFEVRGAKRPQRGSRQAVEVSANAVRISYLGRDRSRYATELEFEPMPTRVSEHSVCFSLMLPPGACERLEIRVHPIKLTADIGAANAHHAPFDVRTARVNEHVEAFRSACTRVRCSDASIQELAQQAVSDLCLLRIQLGEQRIVGAGIPWFCAPFGRDSLLTSYEGLLLNPALAKESLRVLAAYQGKQFFDVTEEEPGKIFHELRFGEMAALGETPHSPYYGTIDATPLFVVVTDATYKVTGDRELLKELCPAVEAALGWIDARTDNATRFLTYECRSERGLANQGWKDSRAALSFPDGRLAAPPIALCEVQGYCVDAYARGARVLQALGRSELANVYSQRAAALRSLVDEHFWLSEQSRYAFALDGRGARVDTVVSNIGHLLWSRVPDADRARETAELLLNEASFSGFGVRTLASRQGAYNPLSYHNGTVWPHDNAIIAKGLANYRHTAAAATIFEGLIAATRYFRDRRLPELFCGMPREDGSLVRYPVACSPQAWASAAPFLLLQATLGIHADAPNRKLVIRNARMPPSLEWVELDNLQIGQSRVSIRFRRVGTRVHVDALEITGAPLRTEIEHD